MLKYCFYSNAAIISNSKSSQVFRKALNFCRKGVFKKDHHFKGILLLIWYLFQNSTVIQNPLVLVEKSRF